MLTTLRPWRQTLAGLVALYILAAVSYGLTLELTSGWDAGNILTRMCADYVLKALLSLPVIYLIFVVLRERSFAVRFGLTLALAIPFVFAWQQAYYALAPLIGYGHLGGWGQWWDIYIPSLFYLLQFGALFAVDYHRRSLSAVQRAEELARLASERELVALKAQVNPHFLYNTFNAISASLSPAQETTRELLAQVADLFRYQVHASSVSVVTLAQEIRFIDDYLAISRVRMGNRLRYRIEWDPDRHGAVPILPMLLQPLVENAVTHGLSPKLDGGTLLVAVRDASAGELEVRIEDSGVGMEARGGEPDSESDVLPQGDPGRSTGTGIGLANTRRRLLLTYGTTLEIAVRAGGGTSVAFRVPVPGGTTVSAAAEGRETDRPLPKLRTDSAPNPLSVAKLHVR